jgi:hypothetical protein
MIVITRVVLYYIRLLTSKSALIRRYEDAVETCRWCVFGKNKDIEERELEDAGYGFGA